MTIDGPMPFIATFSSNGRGRPSVTAGSYAAAIIRSHNLVAGSLVAGFGFCALLPPFEGFDETAHYSYIQQIAQTGTWPRLNDPITADVDDLFKGGA